MVASSVEDNKALINSLKSVSESQKALDNQIKLSGQTWKENARGIGETTSALAVLARQTQSSEGIWKTYVNNVKAGIGEIKNEFLKLGINYVESKGYFDQNFTALQKGAAYLNPSNYVAVAKAASSAMNANLPTVMRDDSTFKYNSDGSVSIEAKTRRITERQAEAEDYLKSLKGRSEAIRKSERSHDLSDELDDINRIEHRGDRMSALGRRLYRASDEERGDKINIKDITELLTKMEGDVYARRTAEEDSKRKGVKNPYEEEITKLQADLEKARSKSLESEDRLREETRRYDRTMRSFKISDETTFKTYRDRNTMFGMNDDEQALFKMKREGMPGGMINDIRGEMSEHRSRTLGKTLEDESFERGEIGMKPRAARDRRTTRDMQQQGFNENQIANRLQSFKDTDSAQDRQDIIDKVKELTKELDKQTAAYKNSRDVMHPYVDLMGKLNSEQKKQVETSVKNNVEAEKRFNMQNNAQGVRSQFGNRSDIIREQRQQLQEMVDAGQIDQGTMNRALSSLTGGGARQPVSGPVDAAEAGSAEALDRLAAFRENAFAGKGDTRGGGSSRRRRMGAKDQQALLKSKVANSAAIRAARRTRLKSKSRRRQIHGSGFGEMDATEMMVSGMLNDDSMGLREESALEDSLHNETVANRIDNNYTGDESLNNNDLTPKPSTNIHNGGASDYWAEMESRGRYRTDPTATGLDSVMKPSTGRDPLELLERIAKATEKEADVKLEVADLH